MSYEEEKNALKEEFDVKFATLAKEEDAGEDRRGEAGTEGS